MLADQTRIEAIEEKIGLLQKTFECPICLEMMKNPVSTRCDHKFCRHCLLETIQQKSTAPCPLCKETFTKRSLQPLPKWKDIVNTVRDLIVAFEEDTGIQYSPRHGPPIFNQNTPQRVPDILDLVTESSAQGHDQQGAGQSAAPSENRKTRTRMSQRKTTRDKDKSSKMEQIFEDADAVVVSGNIKSNINIRSGFPVQHLNSKNSNGKPVSMVPPQQAGNARKNIRSTSKRSQPPEGGRVGSSKVPDVSLAPGPREIGVIHYLTLASDSQLGGGKTEQVHEDRTKALIGQLRGQNSQSHDSQGQGHDGPCKKQIDPPVETGNLTRKSIRKRTKKDTTKNPVNLIKAEKGEEDDVIVFEDKVAYAVEWQQGSEQGAEDKVEEWLENLPESVSTVESNFVEKSPVTVGQKARNVLKKVKSTSAERRQTKMEDSVLPGEVSNTGVGEGLQENGLCDEGAQKDDEPKDVADGGFLDDTQEEGVSIRGSTVPRIFKSRVSDVTQTPTRKPLFKKFGTPTSDDPYSFKVSQRTPKAKAKRGKGQGRRQRKNIKKKQLEIVIVSEKDIGKSKDANHEDVTMVTNPQEENIVEYLPVIAEADQGAFKVGMARNDQENEKSKKSPENVQSLVEPSQVPLPGNPFEYEVELYCDSTVAPTETGRGEGRNQRRRQAAKKDETNNSETRTQMEELVDKISQAEDFDLMMSQQFREMESDAKKTKKTDKKKMAADAVNENKQPNHDKKENKKDQVNGGTRSKVRDKTKSSTDNCQKIPPAMSGRNKRREKLGEVDVSSLIKVTALIHNVPKEMVEDVPYSKEVATDVDQNNLDTIGYSCASAASDCRVATETKMASGEKQSGGAKSGKALQNVPVQLENGEVVNVEVVTISQHVRDSKGSCPAISQAIPSLVEETTQETENPDISGNLDKQIFQKTYTRKASEFSEKLLQTHAKSKANTKQDLDKQKTPAKEWQSAQLMNKELVPSKKKRLKFKKKLSKKIKNRKPKCKKSTANVTKEVPISDDDTDDLEITPAVTDYGEADLALQPESVKEMLSQQSLPPILSQIQQPNSVTTSTQNNSDMIPPTLNRESRSKPLTRATDRKVPDLQKQTRSPQEVPEQRSRSFENQNPTALVIPDTLEMTPGPPRSNTGDHLDSAQNGTEAAFLNQKHPMQVVSGTVTDKDNHEDINDEQTATKKADEVDMTRGNTESKCDDAENNENQNENKDDDVDDNGHDDVREYCVGEDDQNDIYTNEIDNQDVNKADTDIHEDVDDDEDDSDSEAESAPAALFPGGGSERRSARKTFRLDLTSPLKPKTEPGNTLETLDMVVMEAAEMMGQDGEELEEDGEEEEEEEDGDLEDAWEVDTLTAENEVDFDDPNTTSKQTKGSVDDSVKDDIQGQVELKEEDTGHHYSSLSTIDPKAASLESCTAQESELVSVTTGASCDLNGPIKIPRVSSKGDSSATSRGSNRFSKQKQRSDDQKSAGTNSQSEATENSVSLLRPSIQLSRKQFSEKIKVINVASPHKEYGTPGVKDNQNAKNLAVTSDSDNTSSDEALISNKYSENFQNLCPPTPVQVLSGQGLQHEKGMESPSKSASEYDASSSEEDRKPLEKSKLKFRKKLSISSSMSSHIQLHESVENTRISPDPKLTAKSTAESSKSSTKLSKLLRHNSRLNAKTSVEVADEEDRADDADEEDQADDADEEDEAEDCVPPTPSQKGERISPKSFLSLATFSKKAVTKSQPPCPLPVVPPIDVKEENEDDSPVQGPSSSRKTTRLQAKSSSQAGPSSSSSNESDEEPVRIHRRRTLRIDSDDEDSDVSTHAMNVTSSSALSSQSEVPNTQAKQDLELSVENIRSEIARLEAQLAAHQTALESPDEDDAALPDPDRPCRGSRYSQASHRGRISRISGKRRAVSDALKCGKRKKRVNVISSDEEDVFDLDGNDDLERRDSLEKKRDDKKIDDNECVHSSDVVDAGFNKRRHQKLRVGKQEVISSQEAVHDEVADPLPDEKSQASNEPDDERSQNSSESEDDLFNSPASSLPQMLPSLPDDLGQDEGHAEVLNKDVSDFEEDILPETPVKNGGSQKSNKCSQESAMGQGQGLSLTPRSPSPPPPVTLNRVFSPEDVRLPAELRRARRLLEDDREKSDFTEHRQEKSVSKKCHNRSGKGKRTRSNEHEQQELEAVPSSFPEENKIILLDDESKDGIPQFTGELSSKKRKRRDHPASDESGDSVKKIRKDNAENTPAVPDANNSCNASEISESRHPQALSARGKLKVPEPPRSPSASRPVMATLSNQTTQSSDSLELEFPQHPNWSFVASGISKKLDKPYIDKLLGFVGGTFTKLFSADTTHVLVKPASFGSRRCQRTLKYFQAIAHGKWLVSVDWVLMSVKKNRLLPMEAYEIVGDTVEEAEHFGPQKARVAPGSLLVGYQVCCLGQFQDLTKDDLHTLIEACGASVVSHPSNFSEGEKLKTVIVVEAEEAQKLTVLSKLRQVYNCVILMKEWILDSIGTYNICDMDPYLVNQ